MSALKPRTPLCGSLILVVWLTSSAMATELPGHADEPLGADPSLTLEMAVDLTLAAFPDFEILAARKAQADAWTERGGALLSNRPSIMLRYQTDRWGSDNNLTEYEAGITLPLWGWGGRSAMQTFGDALSGESAAAGAALRWQVAGFVREALWNVALAENDDAQFRVPASKWAEYWQVQDKRPFTLHVARLPGHGHFSAVPEAYRLGIEWLFGHGTELNR